MYLKIKNKNYAKDKYPNEIRKQTFFDGRVHRCAKHIYSLVEVYPNFAIYKNNDFPEIKETLDKFELKNNKEIEIISKGDFFEDDYFDIWEEETLEGDNSDEV